jgi:hypothetical protein
MEEKFHSLGQTSEAVIDTRAQAAATLVGLGIAFFGTLGKKEPILIIVGSIMAGIGGAGLISGVVKTASK